MKTIRTILNILAAIIAVVLAAPFFLGRSIFVEKEVVISKPRQEVFNYLKYIRNHVHYMEGNLANPDMNQACSGSDGTAGFVCIWSLGKDSMVTGNIEIKKITEPDRIDYEARAKKPTVIALIYMKTEELSRDQTKVKMGLTQKFPYAWRLRFLLFNVRKKIENMAEERLQGDLDRLKKILENQTGSEN